MPTVELKKEGKRRKGEYRLGGNVNTSTPEDSAEASMARLGRGGDGV